MNVNFEVADVTKPLVAVGGLQKQGGDGPTWKLRDSRSSDEAARQQSGFGTLERCLLDASDVGALQLKNIRRSRSFSDSGKDRQ